MTIPYYCRRCQEMLTPKDEDCPFCGGTTTPVDELADEAIRELSCLGLHDYAHVLALLKEKMA